MNDLGLAMLLMSTLPFAVLATAFFALSAMFKRMRKLAFPGMAAFIGYGLGNLMAHEQWANPILRFTWVKPFIEAPIHSLLSSTLLAFLAFLFLRFRSATMFKTLLGLSLLIVCLPAMFVMIAYGTMALSMALFRSTSIALAIPSLVASPVLTVVLGTYCLRNWREFFWIPERPLPQ
jgi:hypothetical protein